MSLVSRSKFIFFILVAFILIALMYLVVKTPSSNASSALSASEEVNTGLSEYGKLPLNSQDKAASVNQSKTETVVLSKRLVPQNFSEELKRYSPEDRKRIRQFNDDYFGALEFSAPDQQTWLRGRGYPQADDILEAEFLEFEELKSRADSGDRIAMALASERALNLMIDEGLKWREVGQDPLLAGQEFFEYGLMAQYYAKKLLRTGSPFGAYLQARWNFESSLLSGSAPIDDAELALLAEIAVTNLYLAELMGDNRISGFARRFAYTTDINTERLSAIRLAFGTVSATKSAIGCGSLFGTELIP